MINILKSFDKYKSLNILKKVDLNKFSDDSINEYKRILKGKLVEKK